MYLIGNLGSSLWFLFLCLQLAFYVSRKKSKEDWKLVNTEQEKFLDYLERMGERYCVWREQKGKVVDNIIFFKM